MFVAQIWRAWCDCSTWSCCPPSALRMKGILVSEGDVGTVPSLLQPRLQPPVREANVTHSSRRNGQALLLSCTQTRKEGPTTQPCCHRSKRIIVIKNTGWASPPSPSHSLTQIKVAVAGSPFPAPSNTASRPPTSSCALLPSLPCQPQHSICPLLSCFSTYPMEKKKTQNDSLFIVRLVLFPVKSVETAWQGFGGEPEPERREGGEAREGRAMGNSTWMSSGCRGDRVSAGTH